MDSFAFLRSLYQWNSTVLFSSDLATLIQPNTYGVHLCFFTCQSSIPFYCPIVFYYMDIPHIPQFVYPLACWLTYVLGFSRKAEPIQHTHRQTDRHTQTFILKNWLMPLWGWATLKFAGQARRLEIPGRIGVAIWSLKAAWRQNSFLFGELQVFFSSDLQLIGWGPPI